MIGVAAGRVVPADAAWCGLGHVLAGAMLDGQAARLAQMLDPAFLAEAGWDPDRRVLSLPAGHRLLGRAVCRVDGCATTAQPVAGVCFWLPDPADRARAERRPDHPGIPVAAVAGTRGRVRGAGMPGRSHGVAGDLV